MGKQNTSITLNWVASLFEDATLLATNKIWTRKELKMRNSSQTIRLHIGKFVVWLRLWNSLLLIYFLFISKSWYWHRTKLNLKLWCRTCTILYYFYVIDFHERKKNNASAEPWFDVLMGVNTKLNHIFTLWMLQMRIFTFALACMHCALVGSSEKKKLSHMNIRFLEKYRMLNRAHARQ